MNFCPQRRSYVKAYGEARAVLNVYSPPSHTSPVLYEWVVSCSYTGRIKCDASGVPFSVADFRFSVWGAFATKLQKCLLASSCWSLRMYIVTTWELPNGFSWNSILASLSKHYNFWVKSDNSNGHFTWRPTCMSAHFSNAFTRAKYISSKSCRENETPFIPSPVFREVLTIFEMMNRTDFYATSCHNSRTVGMILVKFYIGDIALG
jgi:hypothetical protein